jgi:DNA-binding transcriptional LysR family regulator
MELKDMDLNLLVVFNQLFIERRVSKVAESLQLTQPAVSNALRRLRKLLGDNLFLPTPHGMEPTPYAEQLADSVAHGLGMIHGAVNERMLFEPLNSRRSFRVAMTDIGEIYFLPKLLDAMSRTAPGISVDTVRNTSVNLKDEMEARHIDLAIGLLPQLKGGFFQRRLFRQRYVCMFRKGHRLAKRKVSLQDFCAAEHVVVVSAGTGHGRVDELLERQGIKRRVRLTVPHFVAVGHILSSTDMIATVPERFAQSVVSPFQLAYVAHPATLPEITINLFWHAKYHKDPANQWLRSLIFDMYST